MRSKTLYSVFGLLVVLFVVQGCKGSSVIYEEDFEGGVAHWIPTDDTAWKVKHVEGNHFYSLTKKKSNYKPPFKSPLHRALLKEVTVESFELTVDARTTHKPYNHRDLCLFFGYQDEAHFYYVHLGQETDPRANQIFIVNGAARTKISENKNKITPWKEKTWHKIKIVRDTASGQIDVYFDDMQTPHVSATDKNFLKGQIGLGSFDDTGDWDNLKIIKISD